MHIDFRPFMQRTPFLTHSNASVSRAYRLFRTMGLHHLFVGPSKPMVTGMLTRKVSGDIWGHPLCRACASLQPPAARGLTLADSTALDDPLWGQCCVPGQRCMSRDSCSSAGGALDTAQPAAVEHGQPSHVLLQHDAALLCL